jgi:ribosomal protein S18 acetylase RimI-like enzyme
MIIREYRQADFPEVEKLWIETGVFRPERGDNSETIQRCNKQGGKLLVLEDETAHRIIGTSWLTWDGRRIHLQYFAVLPSHQGNRYGRKLAQASMDFARSKKAPVKLEVHRNNIQAIRLYQDMGFKILDGYEIYMVHINQ